MSSYEFTADKAAQYGDSKPVVDVEQTSASDGPVEEFEEVSEMRYVPSSWDILGGN